MFARYKSFSDLVDCIDASIDKKDFDAALRLIQDWVENVISEPVLAAQVYGSKELDWRCQRIGLLSWQSMDVLSREPDLEGTRDCNLYIVTKLQTSGGHTKVIKDFIAARPDEKHVICSTELLGPSELGTVNAGLANGELAVFEAAPDGSHLSRLRWLQARLKRIAPKRVYLFNHHQDSVAVAAVVPEMEIATTFYHHGDHHLCLGVFLPGIEHVDPHPMGFCNCRDVLKIDNTFIPLVVADRGATRSGFLDNGRLTTCTAARSNKIEIPYYVNYLDVVPELLSRTGGRHIHIGRLTPWALYRLRRGLRKHGVDRQQFIYVPWVSSVWQALLEHKVDLYIASFPYGGGLTLIEAMGAGVPVALHRHMYSHILSGLSLGYPGAFSWHRTGELFEYCEALDSHALFVGAKQARQHYERFHRSELLSGVLNGSGLAPLLPCVEADKAFQVDTDEWAQWLRNNLTFKSLLYRRAFSILKSIRRNMLGLSAIVIRKKNGKKA